ncbi:hypothetical protein ACS0TY_024884 [Phlomoides rotata]
MYLQKPFWSDALKLAAESDEPSPVLDLVRSLDKQRLYGEVTLALRTGLREARAEFSFLRTRGLHSILKSSDPLPNRMSRLISFTTRNQFPNYKGSLLLPHLVFCLVRLLLELLEIINTLSLQIYWVYAVE